MQAGGPRVVRRCLAAAAQAGGAKLTQLSPEQAAYIGVPVEGPYKPDHYRY